MAELHRDKSVMSLSIGGGDFYKGTREGRFHRHCTEPEKYKCEAFSLSISFLLLLFFSVRGRTASSSTRMCCTGGCGTFFSRLRGSKTAFPTTPVSMPPFPPLPSIDITEKQRKPGTISSALKKKKKRSVHARYAEYPWTRTE